MPLSRDELLALDNPAHLGTLDRFGHPRITPIWFVFEDGCFYMSSLVNKRHVMDLRRDPRASIRIDHESPTATDGVRENAQVGARGEAELRRDGAGEWTYRITLKYVRGDDGLTRAEMRAAQDRVLIVLRPKHIEYLST
jgi:nitroimidazol reductase NimA-like FMN-containing flavoprotein (pyridoxamine 5'-phosphate oxidase superfamily)